MRNAGQLADDLREHGVCAGADVLGRGGNPPSRRFAVRPTPATPCRSAIHEQAATPHPTVNPSRFIEPTCGVRRDQPNFSAPALETLDHVPRREREVQPLVLLRLIEQPELHRIDVQFDGQLVDRRFQANKPGTAPGPRIDVGVPTFRRARPEVRGGSACCRRTASPPCSFPCSHRASTCDSPCHGSARRACRPASRQRMRCTVRGRWPTFWNSIPRVTTSFTGRPRLPRRRRPAPVRPRPQLSAEPGAEKPRRSPERFPAQRPAPAPSRRGD